MPNDKKQPSRFDFDPFAAEYDSWYETAEGKLFDILEKKALRRIMGKAQREGSLLEVGAGTGWWSRFFSDSGLDVTGIDISPQMVDIAQSKNIPNASFKLADAHELPFADGSFSFAAAITSIEFARDPERVLGEMVRCTKKPGTLFLGVLNERAPINRKRRKLAGGPFATARFFTPDDIHALLTPYGKTTIKLCAFPLSLKLPAPFAGTADDIQAFMRKTSGAFIAGKVEL